MYEEAVILNLSLDLSHTSCYFLAIYTSASSHQKPAPVFGDERELSVSTTALVVEFVIVGLQVAIWVFMIIGIVSGYQWMNPGAIKDAATPLAVVLVGMAYTLGIVFDAFTALLEDLLFSEGFSAEQRKERRALRQGLRLKDSELAQQLDREQYLLRLLRSTTLNLIIIAGIGIFCISKIGRLPVRDQVAYDALLACAAAMGSYGWWRRRKNFIKNRDWFYEALKNASPGP